MQMQHHVPDNDLACDARRAAEILKELMRSIESHIDTQHQHAQACQDVGEMQRLTDADPYQWLKQAKHALQSGLMFADRAIYQPPEF